MPFPQALFSQSILRRQHSHQGIFLLSCHNTKIFIKILSLSIPICSTMPLLCASLKLIKACYCFLFCFFSLVPGTMFNRKAQIKIFCVFLQVVEFKSLHRTFTSERFRWDTNGEYKTKNNDSSCRQQDVDGRKVDAELWSVFTEV